MSTADDGLVCGLHAQQEGSPLNLLTSMASWVHQAQTALFQMGPSEGGEGESLQARALPNSQPHPMPVIPALCRSTASCETVHWSIALA